MADRYFVNGGVDNNWGTTGNWSTTDGGGGGSAVPTASDAVYFTSNSPNCTVNASNRVCLSLTTTGYTNTLTLTYRITVSGAITIGANTQWAGDEWLTCIVAATHTSNVNVIRNLWFSSAVTHVLADDFTVTNLRLGNSTSATVVNDNGSAKMISIAGNFDLSQISTGSVSGTANLIMTGTGTLTGASSTGRLSNNLTFNTAGTITGSTDSTLSFGGTMTYTAGTVNMTNTLLRLPVAATLNLGSSVVWKSFEITPADTITLSADLYTGQFLWGLSVNAIVLNGNKLYVSGGISGGGGTSTRLSGTTEIVLTGTGVWKQASANTLSAIANKVTIDTLGTITITDVDTNPVRYFGLGQINYVKGTVITDTGTWGDFPAVGNVLNTDTVNGVDGTHPTEAETEAAHLAADKSYLNTHKDEMIAANTDIQTRFDCDAGTAAGGGGASPVFGDRTGGIR